MSGGAAGRGPSPPGPPLRLRRRARRDGPALALLAAALAACGAPGDRTAWRNLDPSVRYVGRDACLPCHARIAETSARTGMGRAFAPMTPVNAVEDFRVANVVDLPAEGLRYVMTSEGGRFSMRQEVLDAGGGVLASAEMPILWILGSGNHSRSYLTGHDGWLYQMPVCWYPGKPGWDLCPGYEIRNHHFTREADGSCLFCHNGRVPLLAGTTNRYGEAMPHGIDCERCHGPGELHVARWRAGEAEPPDVDDTIVNPAKLPPARRMDVCMQCHLGDADGSERVHRTGTDLFDFRPGGDLSAFLDVMTFTPPSPSRFGLGGQADRLRLSRCFTESAGRLDCLTCHDPHVTVYGGEDRAERFRQACLGCHRPDACPIPEARRREESGDDCVACHLRRSEPADQRFTAFTDHWIRRSVDPPGPPPADRPSVEIAPVFAGAHARLPRGEAALDRGRALLVMKTGNLAGPRIPWEAPLRLLREAVAADPGLADAWFLLGKAALARGDANEAAGAFREARRRAPDRLDARRNLAATLLALGRAAEAEPLLRETLRDHPEDPAAASDLARALVVTGREAEARALLDGALARRPEQPTLHANAGLLAARQGRHEDAAAHLRSAAGLEPTSAEVWSALAAALEATSRASEAEAARRRATRLGSGPRR